jgi:hypothetical protein
MQYFPVFVTIVSAAMTSCSEATKSELLFYLVTGPFAQQLCCEGD